MAIFNLTNPYIESTTILSDSLYLQMVRLGAGCTELYIQIKFIDGSSYILGPEDIMRINDSHLLFHIDKLSEEVCHASVSLGDNSTTVLSETSVDCS